MKLTLAITAVLIGFFTCGLLCSAEIISIDSFSGHIIAEHLEASAPANIATAREAKLSLLNLQKKHFVEMKISQKVFHPPS